LNEKKIKGAAHFYLQLSLELNSLKSNTRIHLKHRERGHRENVLFHFFFSVFRMAEVDDDDDKNHFNPFLFLL